MNVRLVVIKGPARTRVIHVRGEETIIGRSRDCDICIPSPEISRRHCLLSFAHGQLTVEDLSSANGTFLNGKRVQGEQLVMPDDVLDLGPLSLKVAYGTAPAEAPIPFQEETPPVKFDEDGFAIVGEGATEPPTRQDIPLKPETPRPPEPAEEVFEVVLDDAEPLDIPPSGNLHDILADLDEPKPKKEKPRQKPKP
jgi:predicted component of type VI protein secretion system